MYRYEQHCPVARAAEVVTESWSLLVVRELMRGDARRADLARALPKMSGSLLTARLRSLSRAGVVASDGDGRYRLTPAGRELAPIVAELGRWGQRWLDRPRVGDLDADVLLLDVSRSIEPGRLPARPHIVEIDFVDAPPPRRWWLALSRFGAVVHEDPPAVPVSVVITCTLGALAGVWLGHTTWLAAVRDRAIMLAGEPAAVRAVIDCLGTGPYAAVPRPAAGEASQQT